MGKRKDEEEAIAKAIALSLSDQKQQYAPVAPAPRVNTSANENEEEAIAKAIALSLSDQKQQYNPVTPVPRVNTPDNEEAAIAKAIALSLSDQKQQYNPVAPAPRVDEFKKPVIKQVRAVYDFEAIEKNEISFVTGDLINVFECSDKNWWRGQLVRGGKIGLFPSSFVTAELIQEAPTSVVQPVRVEPVVPPTPQANTTDEEEAAIAKAIALSLSDQPVVKKPPVPQVDESVMKRCIKLLDQCDPTGEVPDDPELAYVEQLSMAQVPLIDQKLAQIDKQRTMLAQIDVAIREVLESYDAAVRQTNQDAQQ